MNTDFCISIDYKKNSENPGRVFRVITDLIDTCHFLDLSLIYSIDSKIEPVLVLDDIKTGSIRVWLKNMLKVPDDEDIRKGHWKRIIGDYLVKGKHAFIDFLEDNEEITEKNQIDGLKNRLVDLAEQTNVKQIPAYTPLSNEKILHGIEKITEAIRPLQKDDEAQFITEESQSRFNSGFRYSPEIIEDILTERTLESTAKMIMKVKKPDYLGYSQWEMRHNQRNFQVKILDHGWLNIFRSQKIDLRPGDALQVELRTHVKYDGQGDVISEKHEVLKVDGVVRGRDHKNRDLFELENNKSDENLPL